MSWHEQAACAGMDVECFYTDEQHPVAKVVCFDCPVQVDCLIEGYRTQFGLWGGATPRERRKHRSPRVLLAKLEGQRASIASQSSSGSLETS